jgi:bacterioferritin-associated ferredoxin
VILCLCRGVSDHTVRAVISAGAHSVDEIERRCDEILTAELTAINQCFIPRSTSSTRAHIDWIEEQMELIKQVGEAHYLAQQIKEEDA